MVGPKIFQDCAFPFSVSLKFTNSSWFSLCLCVTIYVLVYLSTCLSVSMFVTAYALVSLCICMCLHVCLLACLSACLFVGLPAVFVRLFCVCLTVWVCDYLCIPCLATAEWVSSIPGESVKAGLRQKIRKPRGMQHVWPPFLLFLGISI